MNQSTSNTALAENDSLWGRSRFRGIALAMAAAGGVYLCYRLAVPCIPSLVWAGTLAIVFMPFHHRINARLKNRNLAAALSLALIALLVVAPATWFAQRLAEEVITVSQSIQSQLAAGKWHDAGNGHPTAAHFLAFLQQQASIPENVTMASNWLKSIISSLVIESGFAALQICLTIYFLFYFLRDGAQVLRRIRSVLPLSEGECDAVFSHVNDTIHATFYGMLVLSVLQGALAGLMYWWLGIPAGWLWAVVAAAFAFVPVVDVLVIWLPAGVYLGLEGRWADAIAIAALASISIRALENILYPLLVKNRLKLPTVSVFVALVGGLVFFGWSGIVLGPVVLTVTSLLLEFGKKRMGEPRAVSGQNPSNPATVPSRQAA